MGGRTLVVGELNPDVILSGLPSLPALGKEILARQLHVDIGSSSAICAAGLARLGAMVDFVGKLGQDAYGDFMVDALSGRGVGMDHVIREAETGTGVTFSLTFPRDRALVTYPGCIPLLTLADIDLSILKNYRHLHVGSYYLQRALQPGLPTLFKAARDQGLTTSLDPGFDPAEVWQRADLLPLLRFVDFFLPNRKEACAISQVDDPEKALRELTRHASLVVVKCGSAGSMTLYQGQIVRSPSFSVTVHDTTGAGDSFNAGFIVARAVLEMSLEASLAFANACGALSVTGFGGTRAQPTLDQVQALLGGHH
jgi:sugar/nucleoside kinase (ribokinase family)